MVGGHDPASSASKSLGERERGKQKLVARQSDRLQAFERINTASCDIKTGNSRSASRLSDDRSTSTLPTWTQQLAARYDLQSLGCRFGAPSGPV
ncbi:hypothetical protein M404DRAFT_993911 [Pisolithus tinctorius Marx 270]|uniref:Uncharacterized protein n=1 Tax=Pisolithus tinctorius Marx 270 TaxID=870435 RepID=A0A0C3KTS5_PISTI|nr:hypothetical protein M404DRAFT_993911 [Pisolithus tinctorius Marx 270]